MMTDFPPLQTGDRSLWEGQPDAGLRLTPGGMAAGIFALALLLGCLGIATVVERSVPGLYWTILAPGLILACLIAGTPLLLDQRKRVQTRYRITTQGVDILQGTSRATYPIPPLGQLRITDTAPKTITLGHNRQNRPITLDRLPDAEIAFEALKQLARQDHAA